ncbi:MAG TPA: sugar phosphate isomerase/epimerase family protein [Methylomirabilota bacterium]|nr:sugar phosphate isomerase/epimerase family protein [Methylomirabilota bacterium]
MQLGIFAKTFPRRTFAEALDAVASHGLRSIQFNFSCVGLPTLPEQIEPGLVSQIRRECAARGISIAGVSATFNMIDPDTRMRRARLDRLSALALATHELGCDLLTLYTGTRDSEDMWRAHPENNSPQAWRDLLRGMEEAIALAERHNVFLGVEPETGNVVSSTRKARQLLDELHSSRVKIVVDPANLFHSGGVGQMRDIISEAFQLLGTDIVMAHAKELAPDGSSGNLAPGRGVLDWNFYLDTLARVNFPGPIVMHGLTEADVVEATRFLRSKLSD